MDKQATYELQREREAQPLDNSGEDESITLTCGDGEAEVFFDGAGYVTAACIGGVNMEHDCFSIWQIKDWEKSIYRHLKALEEEAWAMRSGRDE